jgi:pimeloyl-ACP methyl ester carboxylesterase
MIPVVFGDCRGWLHPAYGPAATARGVVLCAPFGYEALCTHRGWLRLAELLAAAGTPVLRFDYPGAGDSAGDEAPNRIPDWLASIDAGAEWLRRHVGVAEVALCGLGLGALLAAASAAQRPGSVAALILLASPASGRAYLRQLTLVANGGTTGGDEPAQPPDWVTVAGFRLHDSDLRSLRDLDLAASLMTARTPRILIASAPRRPALGEAALARIRTPGAVVEAALFEGYDAYMRNAYQSVVPEPFFTHLARWAAEGAPTGPGLRVPASASTMIDCAGGAAERLLCFGVSDALVGVLCEPTLARQAARAPAMLILNTGANPRVGNGRIAVRLARRLAALGVTSLRMDASGIGDSEAALGAAADDPAVLLFGPAVTNDVRAALDALEQRGFDRCMVVGVCSGAHRAFQAALTDHRIVGLALANLPAFDRQAGGAPALDGGPPPDEIPSLRQVRMLQRRLLAEADRFLAEQFGLDSGLDRARRWLRVLQARGTTMLLAYSIDDRALRELRAHFGRRGRHLPRGAPVQVIFLSGTDHTLDSHKMQWEFIDQIVEHLRLHHGLEGEPGPAMSAPMPATAASRLRGSLTRKRLPALHAALAPEDGAKPRPSVIDDPSPYLRSRDLAR